MPHHAEFHADKTCGWQLHFEKKQTKCEKGKFSEVVYDKSIKIVKPQVKPWAIGKCMPSSWPVGL